MSAGDTWSGRMKIVCVGPGREHGVMSITTVTTLNSIYEIDQERSMVRKTAGLRPPTRNQSHYAAEDGWTPYLSVVWMGSSLLFVWDVDVAAEIVRRTMTSQVVTLDGPPVVDSSLKAG